MSTLHPSEASLSQPSFTLSSRAFCCAMAVCLTTHDLVEAEGSMPWDAQGAPNTCKRAKSGPNRLVLHSETTLACKQSVLSVKSALNKLLVELFRSCFGIHPPPQKPHF